MAHKYMIPAAERYLPVVWWALFCIIAAAIVLGTRWGWMSPRMPKVSVREALQYMLAFTLLFGAFWLRYWVTEAPSVVVAVEWHHDKVELFTQRGGRIALLWGDIDYALIPDFPGYRGPYAAHWNKVRLFVHGRRRPYEIPLSYDIRCMALLEALKARAGFAQGRDK